MREKPQNLTYSETISENIQGKCIADEIITNFKFYACKWTINNLINSCS